MAESSQERRKYQRIGTQVEVKIQKYNPDLRDFSSVEALSRNLSQGGVLIHYNGPVEVPSYIIASFSLPGSQEELDFVGKAVRIEELTDGSYEVGVMFMRMIIGDFDRLGEYISEEIENS